jgi:hypothetical protein
MSIKCQFKIAENNRLSKTFLRIPNKVKGQQGRYYWVRENIHAKGQGSTGEIILDEEGYIHAKFSMIYYFHFLAPQNRITLYKGLA